MTDTPGTELQFDRADYAAPVTEARCSLCSRVIRDVYYQVGEQVACESCQARAAAEGIGGSAFLRFANAAALGTLAALLGSALYYAVRALTGYEIGLIAIAVGYAVGMAVRHGSDRRGGWPYQALAMALTYASIASAYVPEILKGIREGRPGNDSAIVLILVTVLAFVISLAAPFLMGIKNVIGILIIGIGLYEAWKINRKQPLSITGPFRLAPAPLGSPGA